MQTTLNKTAKSEAKALSSAFLFLVGITKNRGDLRGLQPRKICAKYLRHICLSYLLLKGEIMFNKKQPRIIHRKYQKLFLCEICLCWDGEIHKKESSVEQKPKKINITCKCHIIKCKICNHKRIMPGSCIWGLEDKNHYYVTNMLGLKPCGECGGKMVK